MTWMHCQNNVTKHFEPHSFCDGKGFEPKVPVIFRTLLIPSRTDGSLLPTNKT